jgi:hypothetical protein
MSDWSPPEEKPLTGVKRCKQTDCAKNLHCFLPDPRRRTPEGTCLDCGADLVDWQRLHRRDPKDIEHTVAALKYEHIRHDFWCTKALTPRKIANTKKFGRTGVRALARRRIETKLEQPGPFADWGQTPFEKRGSAIHFAQHATATCCRRCIEVWYGISRKDVLTADQMTYFAELILRYVVDRVPDLPEDPSISLRKARVAHALKRAG